jgi:regulator of protease activity HflC (stomatin/prohibitin superfamily)
MGALLVNILLMAASLGGFILAAVSLDSGAFTGWTIFAMAVSLLYLCAIGPMLFAGLKILNPNEALVLTLFGAYHGTLRQPGFYWVVPFVSSVNPAVSRDATSQLSSGKVDGAAAVKTGGASAKVNKTISLKAMTLNNDKQKINDALGNPIIIGIVVIWKVLNTAKAVFNVDNYMEYLSIQCDSALRNIVRLYPYDSADDEQEKSLRGSSQELAQKLKEEIQTKAEIAGIEIIEARITHLSYAPEIAAAMLQRQQATAVIQARQMIVEGAVGMVEMALEKLSEKKIVDLDEERKAAMVSNLLVVLCASKDPQPIINSGSIY